MIFSVFQKNVVLVYSWSTLLWYRCYYPHRSRDALSPVCGIFVTEVEKMSILFLLLTNKLSSLLLSQFHPATLHQNLPQLLSIHFATETIQTSAHIPFLQQLTCHPCQRPEMPPWSHVQDPLASLVPPRWEKGSPETSNIRIALVSHRVSKCCKCAKSFALCPIFYFDARKLHNSLSFISFSACFCTVIWARLVFSCAFT